MIYESICIPSASYVSVSMHIYIWKDDTQASSMTCHGLMRSMATSNHNVSIASCGGK